LEVILVNKREVKNHSHRSCELIVKFDDRVKKGIEDKNRDKEGSLNFSKLKKGLLFLLDHIQEIYPRSFTRPFYGETLNYKRTLSYHVLFFFQNHVRHARLITHMHSHTPLPFSFLFLHLAVRLHPMRLSVQMHHPQDSRAVYPSSLAK